MTWLQLKSVCIEFGVLKIKVATSFQLKIVLIAFSNLLLSAFEDTTKPSSVFY